MTDQHNKGPVSGVATLMAEPDMDDGLSAETLALVRKTVKDAGGDSHSPQKPRQKTKQKPDRNPIIGPALSRLGGALRKIRMPSKSAKTNSGQTSAKANVAEGPKTRKRDRTYIYLIAFAVIFFLPGWVVPSVLLFVVALIAITYLSLGPDRINEIVLARYENLKAKNPTRAEALRLWAQQFSARLAWIIGKLPAKWTDGLQLPTFDDPARAPSDVADDPFKAIPE